MRRRADRVSIPFIAGQWSLLAAMGMVGALIVWFQSPSLRGSGRFGWDGSPKGLSSPEFQSPSLRGSGRFAPVSPPRPERPLVSIPFIAGQWSLPGVSRINSRRWPGFNPLHCGAVVASSATPCRTNRPCRFQSPSLRGSGRFEGSRRARRGGGARFNPLHCGAVVASPARRTAGGQGGRMFQSPSLRGSGRFSGRHRRAPGLPPVRFNPLHCGAVVASK